MDSVVERKKEIWRFFVLVDIAVLFILVGVGMILYKNYHQEQVFISEVEKIVQKNFRTDEFLLDIQTTGDFGIAERKMKQYFKELSSFVQNFESLEDDEELKNIFTSENLKSDGPNFEYSLRKISEVRVGVQNCIQQFTEFSTKEYINSLIDKDQLDAKVVELFQNLIEENDVLKRLEVSKDYLVETGKSFEIFLDDCEAAVNFLKTNKGQWVVEGETIVFRTTRLLTEYQLLSQKIVSDSNF